MKSFIAFALFLAVAAAIPVDNKEVTIIRQVVDNIGVNGYSFLLETSDGSSRNEEATLKNPGSESEALEVQGSYSYIGPDGITYRVVYVANENGFQPQGDHIPV